MSFPDFFFKVTPLSKILSIILFIVLPVLGFCLGFYYKDSSNYCIQKECLKNSIAKPSLAPKDEYEGREKITADKIYTPIQAKTLQKYLYNFDELKKVKIPKKDGQEVYLFDYKVTKDGTSYIGYLSTIENTPRVAFATLQKLLEAGYGEFPSSFEISEYEKYSNKIFNNNISGVNGVKLNSDGVLEINFFDSVRAYGGGSSRVGCMYASTLLTMLQFSTINDITMCIDKYPSKENEFCRMDFQP